MIFHSRAKIKSAHSYLIAQNFSANLDSIITHGRCVDEKMWSVSKRINDPTHISVLEFKRWNASHSINRSIDSIDPQNDAHSRNESPPDRRKIFLRFAESAAWKERKSEETETIAIILIRESRKLPVGELSDRVIRKKLKRERVHWRK